MLELRSSNLRKRSGRTYYTQLRPQHPFAENPPGTEWLKTLPQYRRATSCNPGRLSL